VPKTRYRQCKHVQSSGRSQLDLSAQRGHSLCLAKTKYPHLGQSQSPESRICGIGRPKAPAGGLSKYPSRGHPWSSSTEGSSSSSLHSLLGAEVGPVAGRASGLAPAPAPESVPPVVPPVRRGCPAGIPAKGSGPVPGAGVRTGGLEGRREGARRLDARFPAFPLVGVGDLGVNRLSSLLSQSSSHSHSWLSGSHSQCGHPDVLV
jgi:hypothetical protein